MCEATPHLPLYLISPCLCHAAPGSPYISKAAPGVTPSSGGTLNKPAKPGCGYRCWALTRSGILLRKGDFASLGLESFQKQCARGVAKGKVHTSLRSSAVETTAQETHCKRKLHRRKKLIAQIKILLMEKVLQKSPGRTLGDYQKHL